MRIGGGPAVNKATDGLQEFFAFDRRRGRLGNLFRLWIGIQDAAPLRQQIGVCALVGALDPDCNPDRAACAHKFKFPFRTMPYARA